jgi:hypothetical protein
MIKAASSIRMWRGKASKNDEEVDMMKSTPKFAMH